MSIREILEYLLSHPAIELLDMYHVAETRKDDSLTGYLGERITQIGPRRWITPDDIESWLVALAETDGLYYRGHTNPITKFGISFAIRPKEPRDSI